MKHNETESPLGRGQIGRLGYFITVQSWKFFWPQFLYLRDMNINNFFKELIFVDIL